MKILITGAQGQVGTELVKIANNKHHVLATTRSEIDITQLDNIEKYIQLHLPDIVINAAAYTAVDKAEEQKDLAYSINHDGAKNLALICNKHHIPLLHISTDYVFDGTKRDAYTEDDTPSPPGIYGKSKWAGEQAIREVLPHHIILRVAWVFGAQGNNFVKTMLRLAKQHNELNIVSDQFGGPTPARNIAEVLIFLAEQFKQAQELKWGTYHYCSSEKTNWNDFAKEIFKQAKEKKIIDKSIITNAITTDEYPTQAKRPKNSMLNCTKLTNTFGIHLPNWRKGLNEVLTTLKQTNSKIL